MRPKSLLLLALALGCGLIASIGISQVMDRRNVPTGSAKVDTESIYVALTDVNLGDPLTAQSLKLEEWPRDKVPPDAIRVLEEVVDRRPRTKIYAGEPIREAKLISAGGSDSAAEQIPKGFRAIPVRVDAASGAAGLVRPGDRVDVQLFVSMNVQAGISETKAQTIMQNIRVFAVDQHFRRATEQEEGGVVARTITLVVTPEQADKIALAARLGDIRLIMRNPDDKTAAHPGGANIATLFNLSGSDRVSESKGLDAVKSGPNFLEFLNGQKRLAASEPKPNAPFRMLIIEGSQAHEVEFPEDGRLPQQAGAAGNSPLPTEIPPASKDKPLTEGGSEFKDLNLEDVKIDQ